VLIIAVGRDMLAIGKDDSLKMITITEGANAKTVAQILADEEIIKIPKAFEIIAKISGADTDFIPGEYELSPSDAYETIITKLTTDVSEYKETVNITFVEGISVFEAAQKLEKEGVCDAERFIYYFNAGGYGFNFESKLPSSSTSKFYRMEGYLFPDTYTFYVDSDPESVCMKIYQNFDNKMTEKYYDKMNELGMTLDEVITLASIVQAEASSNESMKMVASVFENRLADPDNFPKLESDPTTYYVDEIIKPNIEIPSDSIFEAYDTYQGNGLPPGAIGNPGLDAIDAVLYPADTDYYFFYANIDTKEIYYAKTDEEHEENKRIVQEQQEEANSDEDE
ncbi:MAG: endolytic transglycosylase MltG, partial [Oscillospiraceae bacterium]|nr:endolytic transglycosylase MltG [Oscillospiraceae bacterium]